MYTSQAGKANKQQPAEMKTYSCPCVSNKTPHLSTPSEDKLQYMCAVNRQTVDHEAVVIYSRYSESSWQLGLVYETQLSYDQVRERVCCQERSRGHAGPDHISFISDNSIWTQESQSRQSQQQGQAKYLWGKEIEDLFPVCCERFINNHDCVYVCVHVGYSQRHLLSPI